MTWARGAIGIAGRLAGRHGTALLGLCCAAILWASVITSLSVQQQQATRGALQNTANLASAFEESTIRSIRAVEQTLRYVRASYERDKAGFNLSLWSQNSPYLIDLTFQIAIIAKDGHLVASNFSDAATGVDLSDREHFRVHLDRKTDELFISKPVVGRVSGKWSIQFTRPIIAPDGSFDGVVVVSLDPSELSHFYTSIDLGTQGAAMLVGLDGIVRARAAAQPIPLGQSLAGGALMLAHARAPSGHYALTSRLDGVQRIYAYREVSGFPLIVAVGMGKDEVMASYYANRRSYFAMASVVTALLLAVVALIVRHQSRLAAARKALRHSEAQHAEKSRLLDATLQNMSQGIVMVDTDQVVLVVNRRMGDLFDLPDQVDAVRPNQQDIWRLLWQRGEFGPPEGDFATWLGRSRLIAALRGNQGFYEHHRPNGAVLEVRSLPLPNGGAVQTFADITERKHAEETLRAARDEADRSARAKSEFLAMMSHEIRSPMSGLLGIIELLRETPLAAEQLRMIELVHGSAASLLRIVNDILDFSKMEAGSLVVCPEPSELRRLVATIVEPTALVMADKGIYFAIEIAADAPTWVALDPLRLQQILVNLLGNAAKFTAAGAVRLAVTCTTDPSAAPMLDFAISDTGIGMTAEQLGRLFEPFSQADASTTKTFGGTGLGLTISRRLARLLGGEITVQSEPGKGSVFRLVLPLLPADPVARCADDASPAAERVLPAGKHILVAEDQATNRWLIERQLASFGMTFTAVENGRAALTALDSGPPDANAYDALITDCHMPEIDGIALTRLVRTAEAARGARPLPILGLTADVTTAMRARCLAAGMNDVIAKPVDLHRLRAAVAGLLQLACDETAAPANDAQSTVFDPAAYSDLFADDEAELHAWLAAYLAAAEGLLAGIEQAAAGGDRDALAANAHKLASASLAVGALCLGTLGRRLEVAARDAPEPELRQIVAAVTAAWPDAREAIAHCISTPAISAPAVAA